MERAILGTCQPPHRDPSGRFVTGNSGRPRGPNRVNRCLREAILVAAQLHGSDGRGRGELVGFLQWLIKRDLRSFVGLMARCVPLNVVSTEEPERVFRSLEEIDADMRARGITPDRLALMAENMAARAKANGSGGLN